MLSRVAENLYWMARYLERSENTARLINTTTEVLLDLPRGASFGWDILLKVVGLDKLFEEHYREANESNIMRFLVLDERNPSAIVSSIRCARENSRTFREILPKEFWERVNGLYLYIQGVASGTAQNRAQRYEVLNQIVERSQSLAGLLMGCMSHDLAYEFIRLGRNLERADMTTRIMDINSVVLLPRQGGALEPLQERLWMNVLKTLSAYQMYRRHVDVHVRGHAVLSYLLLDSHFPRTVRHCLSEIEGCLAALPNHTDAMKATRRSWRRLAGLRWEGLTPAVLHEYLDQVQTDLGAIHMAVSHQYFYFHMQQQQTTPPARAVNA
ncbi:alpha-E domain-containing protein [Methylocaldum sp.]|uniref:alpha-E domain-containing protein n=1 Tax=Methylocaldum sp. TaxID=1969727 RepID=UPI002D3FC057|nr:alpha-E domain-containing protein [Methylocaldum sp.]HYE37220.1 alpha-E domain-containing protein [Methylocaldum sp.]